MLFLMEQAKPPLHLRRTEPEHNVARFYMLSLEPTLFGDVSLLRHWGRIGTLGRWKVEIFDSTEMATAALVRLASSKRKRGYLEHR